MTDISPNLALPYIMAAQAQKHVTHNEAVRKLDALVQIGVLDRDLIAPPAAPANGDRYLVPSGATGEWAGRTGSIAAFQDGAWSFLLPRPGWLAWIADETMLAVFDGTAWVPAAPSLNPVALVGINATADATNRLAVASPATLFNHAGNGHQLKINKAAAPDTSAILFQSGFSSRAEIGLAGDDNVHLKVSADGITWLETMLLGPATAPVFTREFRGQANGAINIPFGAARFQIATPDNPAAVAVGGGPAMLFLAPDSSGTPTFIGRIGYSWQSTASGTQTSELIFAVRDQVSGDAFANTQVLRANSAAVLPAVDNLQSLGTAARRWSAIYAATGTIQTSDARDKDVSGDLSFAGRMVDGVEPVLFRWKNGGGTREASATETEVLEDGATQPKQVVRATAGRRQHAGFRAQDLHAAMASENVDFAAWGLDDKDDPDSRQWTRPDQLVPVLWAALRDTRARVADLERCASRRI